MKYTEQQKVELKKKDLNRFKTKKRYIFAPIIKDGFLIIQSKL